MSDEVKSKAAEPVEDKVVDAKDAKDAKDTKDTKDATDTVVAKEANDTKVSDDVKVAHEETAAKAAEPKCAAPSQNVASVNPDIKGVSGWLAFFAVSFGITGIGGVWSFFEILADMTSGDGGVTMVLSAITLLVGGVMSLITLVYIVEQRFIARKMAMSTLATCYVLSALTSLISLVADCASRPSYGWERLISVSSCTASDIITTVGGLVVSAITTCLLIMYFRVSERVKATLVK